MTNPNNAVGTNGAYGGRTSVEAFNDVMNILSRGIISGWECVPNSGLTVSLGGNGNIRDVAAAEDAAGNKTSINNRSGSPINITMAAAPASNSRIDAIVAYVESSPAGSATITDNPGPCGIIPVSGTASSSPAAPNDSAIRTAITADGASGTTAFYVVLAYITIPSGTTDLTADNIAAGPRVQTGAKITADNIDFATIALGEIHHLTLTTSLPISAYNGTNYILKAENEYFSGGRYLLALPSVIMYVSSLDYQAHIAYRIDNGTETQIRTWAHWANLQQGTQTAIIPIDIPKGTHTIEIGFGTNSNEKTLQVYSYQSLDAWAVKIGASY